MAQKKKSWFGWFIGENQHDPLPPFLHLIAHSDAAGYYVPINFPVPLTPKVMLDETAHLWPLGSVQQLSKELSILKEHLEIPDNLKSDSKILAEYLETESQNSDDALWEAQPVATYTALILDEACKSSIKTGAAISFN